MRDYAKVSPQFWVWVRREGLDPDAILVALYLVTCPASNMFGMYYLVVEEMAHYLFGRSAPLEETFARASRALQEVCERGFCCHDPASGMVWVRNMAGWQVLSDWEPLKASDNRVKQVNKEYLRLPENPFLSDIFDRYSVLLHLERRRGSTSPSEGLNKGSPSPSGPLHKQEQEQEQEQDQEQEQEQELKIGGVGLANLAQAIRVPVGPRSAALLREPHLGEWCEPQKWPEVVEVATALGELTGSTSRLGTWPRDSGVKALVELFAAGFDPPEVCGRLPAIVASAWWRAGKRGLSSLTVEVLRRAEAKPGTGTRRQPDGPQDFTSAVVNE